MKKSKLGIVVPYRNRSTHLDNSTPCGRVIFLDDVAFLFIREWAIDIELATCRSVVIIRTVFAHIRLPIDWTDSKSEAVLVSRGPQAKGDQQKL